jgi:Effector-associated domain 11
MNTTPTIETIRELISQGKTKKAAEQLVELTHAQYKDFYESSLLLKNRVEVLEREILEGVLIHSEQSVEQAKILKSLLSLTTSIENAQSASVLEQIRQFKNNLWNRRGLLMGISLSFIGLAVAYWGYTRKSAPKADVFDMVLVMDIEDKNLAVLNTDFCKATLGDTPLVEPFIQNNKIIYRNIPKKKWDNDLKIEVLNPNYFIQSQKEEPSFNRLGRTMVYKVMQKKTIFEGHVQFSNGQAVPFSVVAFNFQNTIFQDTTDKDGHYQVDLPMTTLGKTINLTIKHKGRAVISQNINAQPAIMKILTIPTD